MSSKATTSSTAGYVPVDPWSERLFRGFADRSRDGNFDMNDEPELSGATPGLPDRLRAGLEFLQARLLPVWENLDRAAGRAQNCHRALAAAAIAGGGLAILFGIGQLVCAAAGRAAWKHTLTWAELASVIVALLAVAIGFKVKVHHRWLVCRQAAERLRSLKFESLSRPELWCDPASWSAQLIPEIEALTRLDYKAVEKWIRGGPAYPAPSGAPTCVIAPDEITALAEFYRWKRQAVQERFFTDRAAAHRDSTWLLRLRAPVILFLLSVVMVVLHAILDLVTHEAGSGASVALLLVALAAGLPVLGFCLRAWFGAFELPRRARLFEAKADQLNTAIDWLQNDRQDAARTLYHIRHGEDFFLTEHREWCRLLSEAEWFL